MHVEIVPNRNSSPTILIRETYRQEGKIKKRTLKNITHWPPEKIEALWPLLFADEDQAAKATRDPVAPAKRSQKALEKIATKKTEYGLEAHSFRTLLDHLGGIVRNFCKRKSVADAPADVIIETTPDPTQKRAFDLLRQIAV